MNTSNVTQGISRRDFVKISSTAIAATALAPQAFAAEQPAAKPADRMIGIQVGAVSFVDEGVEPVLDIFQQRGAVNTIFLNTFTYGRGLAGRQIPGQPFPDHGKQESDEKNFHGGNYAKPHAQFYGRTSLKETRAPDFGDLDILDLVLPKAKQRGLKVFCCIEDVWRTDVPNVGPLREVDLYGRRTGTLCLLHPDFHNFWVGLAEDCCRSYDVDGVLFFNERNGPLLNAFGASHAQSIASGRVTCFCEHHQAAAKERGIDINRARQGFQKLDQLVQQSLAGKRPSDGYFVEYLRLLFEYPEILAWEKLFDYGKHQILSDVYRTVKAIRPSLQVGFHIEHVNSFNPIFRASRRYDDLAGKADFLKIVVYNNCGGERYANFIRNIGSTLFRDIPKDDLLRFNNYLLNYAEEKGLPELAGAGLSPDYVARETKRALEGAQGKCKILPGIDIGIPTGRNSRKASPEDTYAATAAALKAGADGLIFSRKYSEMQLANLAAGGKAVKDTLG